MVLFPDQMIEQAVLSSALKTVKRSGVLCSHCHMEIVGRVNRSGIKAYDSYCWSMRFILGLDDGVDDHRPNRVRDGRSVTEASVGREKSQND